MIKPYDTFYTDSSINEVAHWYFYTRITCRCHCPSSFLFRLGSWINGNTITSPSSSSEWPDHWFSITSSFPAFRTLFSTSRKHRTFLIHLYFYLHDCMICSVSPENLLPCWARGRAFPAKPDPEASNVYTFVNNKVTGHIELICAHGEMNEGVTRRGN